MEVLQPDLLVLTQSGHFENTKLFFVVFLGTKSISILILIVPSIANSNFVDQHTSSEEDFTSVEPFPQLVVKVEKQVSGAPPSLSMAGYPIDVIDDNEMLSSKKKGN
jgi:hypothetical protein